MRISSSCLLASCLLLVQGVLTSCQEKKSQEQSPRASSKSERSAQKGQKPSREILDAGFLSNGSNHWETRIQAVRDIPQDLTASEVNALFQVIAELNKSDDQTNILIMNEMMEQLANRAAHQDCFTNAMLAILASPNYQDVVRDYAIQHLAGSLGKDAEQVDALPGQSMTQERKHSIFEGLMQELENSQNQSFFLVGTGINAIGMRLEEFDLTSEQNQRYLSLIDRVVRGEFPTANANRVTTIQIASRVQGAQIAPALRNILANEAEPADIKLSAVAGLGIAGDSEDLQLLSHWAQSANRYQFAAKAAMKGITHRTSQK